MAKLNPEDERRLKEKMAGHARSDDPSGRLNYHTEEIRHLFNEIDEDSGGTLDKDEVARLADKMGHSVKRRHLVDAMKAMDPEGTGEVSFDMFKNWLIDTGRHWADLLVMPEGSIAEVRSPRLLHPFLLRLSKRRRRVSDSRGGGEAGAAAARAGGEGGVAAALGAAAAALVRHGALGQARVHVRPG